LPQPALLKKMPLHLQRTKKRKGKNEGDAGALRGTVPGNFLCAKKGSTGGVRRPGERRVGSVEIES